MAKAGAGEGHHARGRAPQHRARLRAGHLPLGSPAVHRAAALVPAAADPLGDPHDIHEAFLSLACAIICWCRLRKISLCSDLVVAFPVSLGALQAWRDVLLAGSFCPARHARRGCAMHGYSILYSSEPNLGTIYPNGDVARVLSLSVWVCRGRRSAASRPRRPGRRPP